MDKEKKKQQKGRAKEARKNIKDIKGIPFEELTKKQKDEGIKALFIMFNII